jgi:hypothetical protein
MNRLIRLNLNYLMSLNCLRYLMNHLNRWNPKNLTNQMILKSLSYLKYLLNR